MSKMTNLKKGVVGVCAATMLAGMCAVPAFAADGDATIKGDTATEASSAVSIDASEIQISVNVPTSTALGISSGEVVSPKNFTITNSDATFGMKITGVKVAESPLITPVSAAPEGNQVQLKIAADDGVATDFDKFDKAVAANGSTTLEFSGTYGSLTGNALNAALDGSQVFSLVWTVGLDKPVV